MWENCTQEQEDVSDVDGLVQPSADQSREQPLMYMADIRVWGHGTNHEMETQQFDGNKHNRRPPEGFSNGEKMG